MRRYACPLFSILFVVSSCSDDSKTVVLDKAVFFEGGGPEAGISEGGAVKEAGADQRRTEGGIKVDGKRDLGPAKDGPKADGPKADAPKADAPKVDAPKTDLPKIDAPAPDAPKADAPKPDQLQPDHQVADAPPPATWKTVTSGNNINWNAVWGATAQDIWAVGMNGNVMHYNGTTWGTPTQIIAGRDLFAVWGSSASDVWAVGEAKTVWRYSGTTPAWAAFALPGTVPNRTLNGVHGAGGNVYMVGNNGLVVCTNGTNTYSATLVAADLFGVYATGANDVWVVGQNYSGHCTANCCGSGTPTYTSVAVTAMLNGVWVVAANDVWAVGNNGAIYHNTGSAWTKVNTTPATNSNLQALWAAGAADIWAVGSNGGLAHHTGAATWASSTSGNANLFGVWGFSASNIWAVGANGTVLHYTP